MFEMSFITSAKNTKYFSFVYFIVKHSASVYSLYCGMDNSPFSSLLHFEGKWSNLTLEERRCYNAASAA